MIRTIVGVALLACISLAAPVSAGGAKATTTERTTMTTRNRAVVTDFADLFYTQRKPRAAMMKHAIPGYIQHNPQAGDGRDAAIALLEPLFSAPDASFTVKRIIVDGDLAAIHLMARPHAAGPSLAVIDIYRLSAGKIVEHWDAIQPMTPSAVNPHPFF